MQQFLPLAQIAVSVALIVLILLQQKGQALGSAFGQSGSFYATKRGVQKKIFAATIAAGTLFILLSISNLIFR